MIQLRGVTLSSIRFWEAERPFSPVRGRADGVMGSKSTLCMSTQRSSVGNACRDTPPSTPTARPLRRSKPAGGPPRERGMEDDDSRTGYANPPKEHRWKKGQSGNPRRQRAKPPESTVAMIDRLL